MQIFDMKKTDYIEFEGIPREIFYLKPETNSLLSHNQKVTPTDLIKFIPEHVLDLITPIINDLFSTHFIFHHIGIIYCCKIDFGIEYLCLFKEIYIFYSIYQKIYISLNSLHYLFFDVPNYF